MGKQKYPQNTKVAAEGESGKKRKSYSSVKLHAKRDRKRKEANERQKVYAALSIKERIARAKSHRGNSFRELARLENAQIAANKK